MRIADCIRKSDSLPLTLPCNLTMTQISPIVSDKDFIFPVRLSPVKYWKGLASITEHKTVFWGVSFRAMFKQLLRPSVYLNNCFVSGTLPLAISFRMCTGVGRHHLEFYTMTVLFKTVFRDEKYIFRRLPRSLLANASMYIFYFKKYLHPF